MGKIGYASTAIMIGLCGFYFTARMLPQTNQSSFTLIIQEKSFNPHTGEVVMVLGKYFARRADGSTSSGPQAAPSDMIREVIAPRQGISVVLSDLSRTKSTFYGKPRESNTSHGTRCEAFLHGGNRLVGEGNLFGYKVVQFEDKASEKGPDYTVETTIWRAPDLHCQPLKHIAIRTNHSGIVTGRFERSVVKVIQDEPDPVLFEISPDYREVKPSDLSRAIFETKTPNGVMPQQWARGLERQDRKYEESQKYKH